jgi:hypothetical protein
VTVWSDGRFSWPFVTAVAGLCLSLLAADLIWRLFTISFATVAVALIVVDAALIAALVLFGGRFARSRNAPMSELRR